MEMVKITLILSLLFISINAYSYKWDEIADSIAKQQMNVSDSDFYLKIEEYKKQRKNEAIKLHYESTFTVGDTIIIMEYHNPYKNTTHSALWKKGNPDSFITYFYHYYLEIQRDPTLCYFSFYQRKLCENWEIDQIRKEETCNPNDKPSYVISTRLILKTDDKYTIESIFFHSFYTIDF